MEVRCFFAGAARHQSLRSYPMLTIAGGILLALAILFAVAFGVYLAAVGLATFGLWLDKKRGLIDDKGHYRL